MGEVIPLRSIEPAEQRWRDEVVLVCDLAGFPDRASTYLARGTSRARLYFELQALRPDIRSPETSAIYLAGSAAALASRAAPFRFTRNRTAFAGGPT